MRRFRTLLMVFLLVVLTGAGQITVLAAKVDQARILLSQEILREGESLEVTVALDGYQGIKEGLYGIHGTLEYDEEVFQRIEQQDFQLLNSWESFYYNPDNGQFVGIKKAGSLLEEEVFQIHFRTRTNLKAQNTEIGVAEVTVSEGKKDLPVKDGKSVVTVVSSEGQGVNGEENSIKPGQGNPSAQDDGKISREDSAEAATFFRKMALATGDMSRPLLFLGIGLAALLVLISVGRRLRRKRHGFRGILSLAVVLLGGFVVLSSVYGMSIQGELNGDGMIDDADIIMLEKHLVELELLPKEKYRAADMNDDRSLTVTDLALLVKKAGNQQNYQVILTSATENFYPEKGEEISLKFYAQVTEDARIERVTINGTDHVPIREDDTSAYVVYLSGREQAGIQEWKFSKVVLDNGREVKVDFTERMDVLKSYPSFENFRAEETMNPVGMKVSFHLNDEDSSVQSGKMEILKENGNVYETVDTRRIQAGENEFLLELEEDMDYRLILQASYNRDTDQLTDHPEDHSGTLSEEKKLRLQIDYQLQFGELKTYQEEGQQTDTFGRGERIVLEFSSSNGTSHEPAEAVVNGEVCTLTKEEEKYRTVLEGFSQMGDWPITVEKLILSNGKVFELTKEHQVTVEVHRAHPQVKKVNIREREEEVKLDVAFQIEDPDQVLSNKKIQIRNEKDELLLEEIFENLEFEKTLEPGEVLAKEFQVRILADYDVTPDRSAPEKEKVIYGKTFPAQPRAYVKRKGPEKTYFEKEEAARISYEIETNQEEHIDRLVVNGLEISVKPENGVYNVEIPVGNTAGRKKIQLQQAVFAGGNLVKLEAEDWLEVLRDVPSVENFQLREDMDQSEVMADFEVADEDQAFVSGKVRLLREDGSIQQEQTFSSPGSQEFVMAVTEGEIYTFQVFLTSQRDIDGNQMVKDQLTLERTIQMIRDYELEISDMKTLSAAGGETLYFKKGEEIEVTFRAVTASWLFLRKAQINGKLLELESLGNDGYRCRWKGFSDAKVHKLSLEAVWLDGDVKLRLETPLERKVEILKEVPRVEKFRWEKNSKEQLQIQYHLSDADDALIQAEFQILGENGDRLLTEETKAGDQVKKMNLPLEQNYQVRIVASYDLDTDALGEGDHEYQDQVIFEEGVAVSREALEFKEVTEVNLYRRREDLTSEKVDVLDIRGGIPENTEDYYAVVQMRHSPDFYGNIREFRKGETRGKLSVILDQDELVQYQDEGGSRRGEFLFEIPCTEDGENDASQSSAAAFFDQMEQDLGGVYEMTQDLDASDIPKEQAAVLGNFTGELRGNGHRIFNLPVPLFQTVSGGRVENLIVENAGIRGNFKGILAGVIQKNSTIEDVHIVNSSLHTQTNQIGAFTGILEQSVIRSSSAGNVTISGTNTIGGIAGQTNSQAVIEDCYVTGSLQGTTVHDLGARVGGVTGWHSGKTIERCFTKVEIAAPDKKGSGGIIGGPQKGSVDMRQVLSMSRGNAYRVAGFPVLENAQEIYEYAGSDSVTNKNENNAVAEIEDVYRREFFEDALGFRKDTWHLDLVEHGKLPSLRSDPVPKEIVDYEIQENKNGIPHYQFVRTHPHYQADRELAYANVAKLMPFVDSDMLVHYGNQISAQDSLTAEKIRYVLPLDREGRLVPGIERDNPEQVKRIRAIFQNDHGQEYRVSYQRLMGGLVAVYQMDNQIPYQFGNYVSDIDEEALGKILDAAKSYDYASGIADVTPEKESRLYVDFYEEQVRPELEGKFRSLLSSWESYPTYCENQAVQKMIWDDLGEETRLKKLLYGMNYYEKWYRISFGEISLSDLLMFYGEQMNPALTPRYLWESVLTGGETLRATENTHKFYDSVLRGHTRMEMLDFLSWLSRSLAGYDDPSDWFRDNFGGILKEQEPYQASEDIRYRIFDIFANLGERRKIVLPILTAPQEDMYLISTPSQLVIGSMNRYKEYIDKDGNERGRMEELIGGYAQRMGYFYGTSAAWVPGASRILNGFVNVQYDTRFHFPQSESASAGTQEAGSTKDPVMKWVYEAIGSWGSANGSGAYANGTDVYWIADAALGGEYNFFVFSHETAHNQDGRYFYGGYGRRAGTGGEAHADGNIAQQIGDGSMLFNISTVYPADADVTNNFTFERIDSPEKLHSYYREMFESGYVLDYLAGQAFLRLDPEEQAKVAVQVNYQKDGTSLKAVYTRLSAGEFADMNLQSMGDLWDHRIAVKDPGEWASAASGSYGYESFYDMNWYQPHNDDGSPNSHSFKRLGQEMLGIGGYENGYIPYISAQSANDLEALRRVTGDSSITWREYKQNRYAKVEANLDQIPYFDNEEVIEQFEKAFRADAKSGKREQSTAVKRMLHGIVKRATDDFRDGGIYGNPVQTVVTSAEQLIQLAGSQMTGNYRLGNDLDFSGIEANGSYVTSRFIGTLDAEGYQITGLRYPLFQDMVYGQIRNLTVLEPSYEVDAQAMLAVNTKNVTLENVRVEGADQELPMVRNKSGAYYEYGDVKVTVRDNEIHTVEDFLAIGDSEISRKKSYVLKADLDFADTQIQEAFVVPGTFRGRLEGGGHILSNLPGVIFESMEDAAVNNLGVERGILDRDDQKGILANRLNRSEIQKVYLADIQISNRTNQVGGLAGQIQNSSVQQVSVENLSIRADNTIGGLAGQIENTVVENCLVTGQIEGMLRHVLGARVGGVTGWMGKNAVLENCYTKVEITALEPVGNGGLTGGPNSGSVEIRNSISLSTGANASRVAGFPVLGESENIYEYAGSDSQTNITDETREKVKEAVDSQITDRNFYLTELGWSEEVWDFSKVGQGEVPHLRDALVTRTYQALSEINDEEKPEEILSDSEMEEKEEEPEVPLPEEGAKPEEPELPVEELPAEELPSGEELPEETSQGTVPEELEELPEREPQGAEYGKKSLSVL